MCDYNAKAEPFRHKPPERIELPSAGRNARLNDQCGAPDYLQSDPRQPAGSNDPEVLRFIGIIRNRISTLDELNLTLRDRLVPVSFPCPPTEGRAKYESVTDLGTQLAQFASLLDELIAVTSDQINRLQI